MNYLGIIPHAGEMYSGLCRTKVFDKLDKPEGDVIYIANDHYQIATEYFYKQDDYPEPKWILKIDPKFKTQEHSYRFVKDELVRYYQKTPKVYIIGKKWLDKKLEILNFIKTKLAQKCVVLISVDMTHYGQQFNFFNLEKPVLYGKVLFEENLIKGLIDNDVTLVSRELDKFPDLTCSKNNLKLAVHLSNFLSLKGRVVEYYDSSKIGVTPIYKRYAIPLEEPEDKFVSYLGLVYYQKYPRNIFNFDKRMALAYIRSTIEHQRKFRLPKWSFWYRIKKGAFVQSYVKGKQICCIASYENGRDTTADIIIDRAEYCLIDAPSRHNVNYTDFNLDQVEFSMELIQRKKDWKIIPATEFVKTIPKDNPYGIILKAHGQSSVFVPYVWRDLQSEMNASQLLDSLFRKASGKSDLNWDSDPKATVEMYTTRKISTLKKSVRKGMYKGKIK